MHSTPEIIEQLRKMEIFSDFAANTEENRQILEKICTLLECKEFNAGDMIINEGRVGDSLHILAEGKVQIMRNTLHDEPFAVTNLNAEQNVFFGEMGLVDQDKRSASVKALTNCKTFKISGTNFIELCEKEPLLGYKTLYRIAKRLIISLKKANSDVTTLYQALLDEVSNIE